ncbi:MAG: hypothetical protein JST52_02850 [Bacteroidetes bacterium]|nr:hypothetical protein [Bacteroidota bacterium]MBS1738993.1 hypothetical protein [Bacteroidota bacterium]MBS1775492.1 hypothetical protein [Bacteroidota bacterium]
MKLTIEHWIRLTNYGAWIDGQILTQDITSAEALFRSQAFNYAKFFKMDQLCKWAWLGTELLLHQNDQSYNKNQISVVFATAEGCIEVDKRYRQSMTTIPSPALFVYTLNNIMLGEVCIRHGFKGEQACLSSKEFDADELFFWASDLLTHRGMDACLLGWINITENNPDLCLFWVTHSGKGHPFSKQSLQQLYSTNGFI